MLAGNANLTMTSPMIDNPESVPWTMRLPRLEGRLVSLREVQLDDTAQVAEFLSDPRVSRHVSPPPRNIAEIEDWIRLARFRRGDGLRACFAIRLQHTDSLIGIGQIFRPPGHDFPEWGWSLSPCVWGTGVFIEVAGLLLEFARDSLASAELVARVFAMNYRAEQALRKLDSELISAAGPVHIWRTTTTSPRSLSISAS